MKVWKLSLKTDSLEGYSTFDYCIKNNLIGVGWSHHYEGQQINDISMAKKIVMEKWHKWPYQIKYLLEEMKSGDLVWIHQNGCYYLVKVNDEIAFGNNVCVNFRGYDLGHVRYADIFKKIPHYLVSGKVQRGCIARRTIQGINLDDKEKQFYDKLSKINIQKDLISKFNIQKFNEILLDISKKEFYDSLTYEDTEDLVGVYLQSLNWFFIKSSSSKSTPKFEFTMMNNKFETARVQVKSGRSISLDTMEYKEYTSDNEFVYLFSTATVPYKGEKVKNIITINQEDLFEWTKNNIWALTPWVKYRLFIMNTL